jgi:Uncharacterized Fe-S protein PflX, homolog of pyruvate formate lyase activating proteins
MILIHEKVCNLCPRQCGAERSALELGYCQSGLEPEISTICMHKGEEPVLSGTNGVCNVFFQHCNMQCIYCQNYQISNNRLNVDAPYTIERAADEIEGMLDKGATMVGFVSPSHQVLSMVNIVNELHHRNRTPRILYNTNGYDNVETLRGLEDVVDIYLPDFKYASNDLGATLSKVPNYFSAASMALREMYRQKGSYLSLDNNNVAESGLIIRHLVLPGFIENSIEVLDYIAEEISLNVHVSLMAQYLPTERVPADSPLNSCLSEHEYQRVVDHFYDLGFRKGWVQELESASTYNPDFTRANPFEG